MKQRHPLILVLAVLLLALTLAACGGGEAAPTPSDDGGQTAAATSTPVPATDTPLPATDTPVPPTDTPVPPTATPQPEPTDTPEAPTALVASLAAAEDVLKSYRSISNIDYAMQLDNGESQQFSVRTETEWAKAPNERGFNMHLIMSGFEGLADVEGAPGQIEMYIVDETTYMNFDGQWVTTPAQETTPADIGAFQFDPDQFFDNFEDLERQGTETVNGVETVHYTFSNVTNVGNPLLGPLNELESLDVGEVDSTWNGDIWVAEEGNYPVRMTLTASINYQPPAGSDEPGGEVQMSVDMDMFDVNEDFQITAPEGAPQPGQVDVPGFEAGTFPLPAQTTVQNSFAGIVTLVSQLSQDDVQAFYDQQLPALGWTKSGDFLTTWSKDGSSFQMLIAPGDDGNTSITIMSQ